MKRTKRTKKRGSGLSLFAFQDIICAVVGILFLIVLLAALDIVENIKHADSESDSITDVLVMQGKIELLKSTKASLSQDLLILIDKKNSIIMGPKYYESKEGKLKDDIAHLTGKSNQNNDKLIFFTNKKQVAEIKLQNLYSIFSPNELSNLYPSYSIIARKSK